MSTNATRDHERIADLPVVGTDAQGATHHLHLTDRVVYVVRHGRVVQVAELPDDSLQQWVRAVADQAGWDSLNYDERQTSAWLADEVASRV